MLPLIMPWKTTTLHLIEVPWESEASLLYISGGKWWKATLYHFDVIASCPIHLRDKKVHHLGDRQPLGEAFLCSILWTHWCEPRPQFYLLLIITSSPHPFFISSHCWGYMTDASLLITHIGCMINRFLLLHLLNSAHPSLACFWVSFTCAVLHYEYFQFRYMDRVFSSPRSTQSRKLIAGWPKPVIPNTEGWMHYDSISWSAQWTIWSKHFIILSSGSWMHFQGSSSNNMDWHQPDVLYDSKEHLVEAS